MTNINNLEKFEEPESLQGNLKLVAKTTLLVFITIAIGKIISYAYRIVIGRFYGPEVYGLFSLAISILGLFVVAATLGLTGGLTRYIAFYRGRKDKNKIKFIIKRSFLFLSISSIILGFALYFASGIISTAIFHNPGLIIFLKFFSIAVPITVFLNAYLSILLAYEKTSLYSFIFNFLLNFAKLTFLAILIFLGLNTDAIIYSHILAVLAIFSITYLICKYKLSEIFLRYSLKRDKRKEIFGELLSYSWPLVLFGIIEGIFYWTDTFMIGYFQAVKEVGLYNAAVPIALLLILASEIFMQIFFPVVTREFSKGNKEMIRKLSKQVEKWILMINTPVLILMLIFPGAIINIFFGSQYFTASNALRFLAIGIFASSLFTISRNLLSMAGKSRLILYNIIIAGIINIILNAMLIPIFGITGASAATMISLIFLGALFVIQAYRKAGVMPFKKDMIKIILVSLTAGALLFFIRYSIGELSKIGLIILGIFYAVIYVLLILLTKSFDKNDLEVLTAVKNKINEKLRR